MEFRDLLSFYFERSNAANSLWGFYITVVLGLLAYFGAPAHAGHGARVIIVFVGFIGFAYVNLNAILEVARARHATAHIMMAYRAANPADQAAIDEMKKTVQPSSIRGIGYFHIASDIAVLAGLAVLTMHKL